MIHFKQATPLTQEISKDEFLHLPALWIQVAGAAKKFCCLLQLQFQFCRRLFVEFKNRALRKEKEKNSKRRNVKEISEANAPSAQSSKSKIAITIKHFLNWCSVYYKLLADALDEGERIHQLVEERKEEERLKAIRNGIPYRFY